MSIYFWNSQNPPLRYYIVTEIIVMCYCTAPFRGYYLYVYFSENVLEFPGGYLQRSSFVVLQLVDLQSSQNPVRVYNSHWVITKYWLHFKKVFFRVSQNSSCCHCFSRQIACWISLLYYLIILFIVLIMVMHCCCMMYVVSVII